MSNQVIFDVIISRYVALIHGLINCHSYFETGFWQNRTSQDLLLFKDGQLQDAQAWMARAQELDAYHVNTNNTLHAELRDRNEQLNQFWMGYQRQVCPSRERSVCHINYLALNFFLSGKLYIFCLAHLCCLFKRFSFLTMSNFSLQICNLYAVVILYEHSDFSA